MSYNTNLNDIIQNISLDGTNINDLPRINLSPKKQEPINKNILKSITDEIINNLKDFSSKEESLDESVNESKKEFSIDDNIEDNIDDNIDVNADDDLDEIINQEKLTVNKNKKKIDNMQNIEKKSVNNNKNILSYLFDNNFGIKDFILLFSIYFILSQDMIKDLFASYFTCLNPDDEGKVNVKGVIVYGLILTIIFMISKKYLL